jgi:alginate O-acetyltransferase complex protein AlgI
VSTKPGAGHIAAGLACVSTLIFYKYSIFLANNVIGLLSPSLKAYSENLLRTTLPLAPPLGISFFMFEFVHYLAEVYKGGRPIRTPATFALFAIFWPSLVAGPIKRYRPFLSQLNKGLKFTNAENVRIGMSIVAVGAVKKIVGDSLSLWISANESQIDRYGTIGAWCFVFALGARILLDFSGYSDMAIGFARMMGIRLPPNFNWPYLATSLNDFWRRWHISLSSWIRDYLYIPLGGNRVSLPRRLTNVVIAMVVVGLWHGAAWNFVIWGLYHGAGLIASTTMGVQIQKFEERFLCSRATWVLLTFQYAHVFIGWASTLIFVMIGWVLFFYPLDRIISILKILTSWS